LWQQNSSTEQENAFPLTCTFRFERIVSLPETRTLA
jgi:hypothetical protein